MTLEILLRDEGVSSTQWIKILSFIRRDQSGVSRLPVNVCLDAGKMQQVVMDVCAAAVRDGGRQKQPTVISCPRDREMARLGSWFEDVFVSVSSKWKLRGPIECVVVF